MIRKEYINSLEFYKGVTIVRLKGNVTAYTIRGVQAAFAEPRTEEAGAVDAGLFEELRKLRNNWPTRAAFRRS